MGFDLGRAFEASRKALGPHPAFMDSSVPVATYSPGSPRKASLISQSNASRHSSAYGGDQAIDWVYDCIGLYADPTSTATYALEKPDGTRLVRFKTPGTPDEYEVGPKALYDLLDQPNPYMLYHELVALLVIDVMLVGNAYWFKWQNSESGRPLALYRLAPSHVKIKPGPYGPLGYEYQPPGVKDKLTIDPSDVIHFRRPNPHSNWYGMGVIQGAGRSMDLELAITDTVASYYENKADPSLIVQSDRRVPRDVFNKLRAQLRARTAGSSRAGELLVLEAGLKASTLSASASDAMFATLSQMSRDRVFSKFRVNPMLLGIQDESAGSNKIDDVRADFDNSTLRPFMAKLAANISIGLADAYDVKYTIEHRATLPADLQLTVAGTLAKLPGTKIREVRRQLAPFGIEESTGDPDIDNFVLNKPGPELDENGQLIDPITGEVLSQPNVADQPLPGEAGRPPKAENTQGFGTANASTKALGTLEGALAALEAKAVSTPAPDNRLPGEVRPDDKFGAARKADIDSTATLLRADLASAASELERALLDHVEGKALKTSDIVSRIKNSAAWKNFRRAVQAAMRDRLRQAASSGVIHTGLMVDDDIDYEAIAEDVMGRKGGLTSIVNTLKDRVVGRVRDARAEDAERHDYNAVIQGAIQEWSTGSAATIADTEATHAYNEATLTVAELAGVKNVFVEDGGDSDEPCAQAHGSVWDIATARERRLEHPNCRRAFLPLTAAEVS